MEDADFLKAARTMLDAAERADEHVRAAPSTWRRLLEMAERWHAEHDHDAERTAAEMVASWDDVPDGHSLALAGKGAR